MISSVVLVKNQAEQLKKCLESLTFSDEIIVIDDYSTDNSADVAEKLGAKVYKRNLNDDFAQQRNFGMGKAKNEWIFFIDADEIVSQELAIEMYQQTSQFLTELNGYYVKRRDYMFSKLLRFGDAGNTKLLRLAKKTKGEWTGKVHERWNIVGEKGILNAPLNHYPHQSVKEFLFEVNFYSTLRAKELHQKNVKARPYEIIFYPVGKFLVNYFIKLGFLDGVAGIISALIMSFYSFLVRGKLWQLTQVKRPYEFGN
ncbi:glycosyltransferase family 2 protein [soil metagenome]